VLGQFGIGAKLRLAFGGLAAVTVLVVVAGFLVGRSVTRDISLAQAARAPASLTSAQAQASLLRMQLHLRGYLVLGDPADIEQYQMHQRRFEANLAALQALAKTWEAEDARQVEQLTRDYARWVPLPQQLFELHDNPLKNRPALRLARLELQPRKVELLKQLDAIIGIQEVRAASAFNRELLADLRGFQTSFDAMVTNLMAYAASGEVSFKFAYGPQLATNAALWHALSEKRGTLTRPQQERFEVIARRRAEISELALDIVNVISGQRASEAYLDLHLYRTEAAPQAQALLRLLEGLTAHQQAALIADLGHARESLDSARVQAILGGLSAIGLAVALTFVAERYIVGPMRRLTKITEQVAAGSVSPPGDAESKDEIERLTHMISTRLREHDLQQLMASISDAVWSAELAPGGTWALRYCSPVVERIAGWPAQHFLESPQRWLDTVHPDDRATRALGFERITAGATDREEAEYRIVRPDGAVRWVRDSMRATRLEDGRIVLNGVLSDLTERKQVEAERQARQAAELANRAKSVFLANMSHELRTPLNAILGFAQLLKRDAGLSARQLLGLNTIQQGGEHLLKLITDILDLAKVEAGKLELDAEPVNLPLLLEGVADIIRVKADEKSLRFVIDAAPDLPQSVRADNKHLRQVLFNLLSNAVKFTERGRVDLRARVVFAGPTRARLCFEVQDSGAGIASEHLETIFQPFEQLGPAQHRAGGTGLGLAISRQLVRLMGSDIHVESEPGQGSRFWFEVDVPVIESAAQAVSLQGRVTGYEGARKTVLIVDDVAGNRAIVAELLGSLGFECREATNGVEMLARSHASHCDLIITDVVMPVMDGIEATHRLRRLPALAGVPVLAVSANVSGSDEAKCLAAGANAFLPKPIDFDRLLQQLGTLLQLTWSVEQPLAAGEETGPIIAPPQEEIESLYLLAKIGNMGRIRERADYLGTLGDQYRPFAKRLRSMAERFQSHTIVDWISRYRDG